MSNVLRRSRDPQYLHLYRKCIGSYQTALSDLSNRRYSECLWNAYEVLEFFWKAIYFLQNGRYLNKHLPQLRDSNRVSTFLQNYIQAGTLQRIQSIYARYNPRWQRNPQQRMQPRYGDERTGLPPSRLYNQRVAQRAVRDCLILARELAKVHREIMLRQSELLVGILNGTFSRSRNERRCNIAPYAGGCNATSWHRYLSRIPNVRTRSIAVSEMDNSLCAVINPFGEAYPEKPSASNIFPAYGLIRDYIFFGGVFISCGGLPFTYYFDVISGLQHNTSAIVRNIPINIRLTMSQGRPQVQVLSTTLLVSNLIQRDFGIMTTMDDPSSGHVGPISLQIYQNSQDTQFWICSQVGNTFHEFRSINPSVSPAAIPIVHAQRFGQEIFPVAFVRYGFGLLLHIGLDLSPRRNAECNLAKEAVRGLLQNYLRYF